MMGLITRQLTSYTGQSGLWLSFINALSMPWALINQRLPLFLPHMHLLSCPQLQSFGKVPVCKNLAKNKKLLKSAENLQQLKTYYLNMLVNCCSVDKGLNEKGGKVKKKKCIISSLCLPNTSYRNKCYSSTHA